MYFVDTNNSHHEFETLKDAEDCAFGLCNKDFGNNFVSIGMGDIGYYEQIGIVSGNGLGNKVIYTSANYGKY